jgi:hypothetical protein
MHHPIFKSLVLSDFAAAALSVFGPRRETMLSVVENTPVFTDLVYSLQEKAEEFYFLVWHSAFALES